MSYAFRIMICLPGDQPVELMRSRLKYQQSYWNNYTRDLDPAWLKWCEHRMPSKNCITRRHEFAR